MKTKSLFYSSILLFVVVLIFLSACKKEKNIDGTDQDLYDMATATSGFTWFKNSSVLLNKSSGSGHPQPYLRTRYNTIAATKIDSAGDIILGTNFPEGSLVVKELFENSTTIARYAILYKNSSNENADANGWVWGYINEDMTVAELSSNKGASCKGCHSQSDNIDYMLMNKYFP